MDFTIIAAMISAGVSIMSMLAQKDYQNEQNSFNSTEAAASRQWASEPDRFQRMTRLGFNPDLAAASIMGNVQSVPYAASAASTPDVAGNADLFTRMLSQLPQDIINQREAPEKLRGLQLNNDKTEIEKGLIGPSMQANINYLNSYADQLRVRKQIGEQECKLIKERAKFAVPLAQEEYLQAYGTTNEIFARVGNFIKDLEVKNADIDLKKMLRSYYYYAGKNQKNQSYYYMSASMAQDALASLYSAQENLTNAETKKTIFEAIDEYFDVELRSLTSGLPIQSDLMKQLALMHALGDPNAKKLRNALLDGDRQLYDFTIETKMRNYWNNFLLGVDAGDVVGFAGDALMTYGLLSGRNPSSKGGKIGSKSPASKTAAGRVVDRKNASNGFKSSLKRNSDGTILKSWQDKNGNVHWSKIEDFLNQ